jgi:phosphoserine phosphatase
MRDEIAVFDIDGTLADVSERLHHVRAKPKNWNAFFAAMAQDKAIASMVRLCNLLHDAGVRIVLCSGAGIDRTHVLFIVEDRSSVVEMWRQQGFVCLQCAPGDF